MDTLDAFYGPNAGYVQELYDQYLHDPNSVDATMRAYFETHTESGNGRSASGALIPAAPSVATPVDVTKVVSAARMARSIREYGHLAANIDPLGAPRPGDPMLNPETHGITDADLAALPATIVWKSAGPEAGTCLDAIHRLEEIYSGPLGYDFDHVNTFEERNWLHENVEAGTFAAPLSPDERRRLLQRLTEVESFEQFLHRVYPGQKRFSIEGDDMVVPMLDAVINAASADGAQEVLIGMAHRGRLNVLAHLMHKPYATIFYGFQSAHGDGNEDGVEPSDNVTGDVKYHLGYQHTVQGPGTAVNVTLANNPSHLEFVNPVTEGECRAAQEDRQHAGAPSQDVCRALAVTLHGDAAFPGEGIVSETLNLSHVAGYQTGGTLHVIVNNQIGFTTSAAQGRSTLYASDLAKGFEIPIVHVNADNPEACLTAVRLAFAYRRRYHKDFLIDLVGYRRWGHNEGDEPSFTQPQMYTAIRNHPTVRALYARQLETEGVVTAEEAEGMVQEVRARLQEARDEAASSGLTEEPLSSSPDWHRLPTAVEVSRLQTLNRELLQVPPDFTMNPRLKRILDRRLDALDAEHGIDWAQGEALAFASLLSEGTPIRLTGQDAERGTFSQRHLVLHDVASGETYVPLQHLTEARASFAVYNSPLSEAAVLGFEYGYSVHAPHALVLWEAQFGDFANAAQVIVDQFLAAARAKWRELPALVMLLPHGYEGQGPEHSSARLERYLQLAAEDNVRVANVTTPAQYFHLLRLQAANLAGERRPLILMTPKSLLRHPRATSSLQDLALGEFQPVLEISPPARPETVERLILCSGKVAVDLEGALEGEGAPRTVTAARVELLYPFPKDALEETLQRYPKLREVVWLQEEPANMGAWTYIAPRLRPLLPADVPLQYVGRPERASTAEGSATKHAQEQERLLRAALANGRPAEAGSREIEHVR